MNTKTPQTDAILERLVKARAGNSCDAVVLHHARKLELERDEAQKETECYREFTEHWKIEYEIVEARLRGKKHQRDNGIISEEEIIPKLTRERDEAREALDCLLSVIGLTPIAGNREALQDAVDQGLAVLRKWEEAK